jgi:uncharacterized membrane protein YfcA
MILFYLILGLLVGIFSGFLGLGGGVIIIPIFVYLFGLTEHQAQGTTLALMVPPVGLLAAYVYYLEGNVKLNIAVWVAIGFFVGGLIGAILVHKISDPLLRKIFGIFLLLISIKMIFGK